MSKKPTYEELELRVKELEEESVMRRQAEDELRDSEKRSRAWLEHSPICTKIVDLDFNLQYMSSAGIKELQLDDITQYYGKPYPFDFYPESFRIRMTKNLKKARETGEIITQEASVVDINGNELWYYSTIVPVNDEKGRIEYTIVISIETTKRKQAEMELQKHRQRLEELVKERTVELEEEIDERKRTEEALRKSEQNLIAKTEDLEALNAALKVLLDKRQEEKIEIEEKILSNVRTLIEPYLAKLKQSNLPQSQKTLFNILESNLNEIISPFTQQLSSKYLNLSPTEIKVANLVKQEKTNKEIAEIQGVTSRAIAFHRGNIRKKLGLKNKKVNLKTYLMSLNL